MNLPLSHLLINSKQKANYKRCLTDYNIIQIIGHHRRIYYSLIQYLALDYLIGHQRHPVITHLRILILHKIFIKFCLRFRHRADIQIVLITFQVMDMVQGNETFALFFQIQTFFLRISILLAQSWNTTISQIKFGGLMLSNPVI